MANVINYSGILLVDYPTVPGSPDTLHGTGGNLIQRNFKYIADNYYQKNTIDGLIADVIAGEGGVASVNAKTGIVVLKTNDISESGNLYYTEARVLANNGVSSGLSHISDTNNPHSVTKTQVGLSNVINSLQLIASGNLQDLTNATTARTNLGLNTMAIQAATGVDITGGTVSGLNGLGFTASTSINNGINFGNDFYIYRSGSSSGIIGGNTIVSGASFSIIKTVPSTNIDWTSGNIFTKSVSADTTFTFTNTPNTYGQNLVCEITNSAGTGVNITFPTAKWPSGTVISGIPTGGINIYTFMKIGSNLYANCIDNMR